MIRDIVAVDREGGMAVNGKTPWNIPADIEYFHQQSKRFGGNLLIGRGTYQAMKKGLIERGSSAAWPPVGRHVFVLTSHDLVDEPGVTIVRSLASFLSEVAAAGRDIWNGSIAEVEPDEIYITRIDATYDCDKFYPLERLIDFHLISRTPGDPLPGEPKYVFEVYARS